VNGNEKLSSEVPERGLVSSEVKQFFFFSKKNFWPDQNHFDSDVFPFPFCFSFLISSEKVMK